LEGLAFGSWGPNRMLVVIVALDFGLLVSKKKVKEKGLKK